ncbi:MAG: hypothetical protein N3A01_08540, partial [Bacteroidales bacterium]|nr:hypothetical protein [Bacteroidales bacterium]
IIDEKRGWVTKEEREKGLFEIRIELARELKQSKEERNETFKNINRIERENKEIEKILQEHGIRATRNNIIKYRLFLEMCGGNKKLNAICVYTGKPISFSQVFNDIEVDVEHIIPKSLLFDDSQNNKTLTFRSINQEKGNRTAYDYMASKGTEALNEYIERVNKLYKDGFISKSKWEKLLTPANKIPQDFIQRQLRETQYVTRKAREILSSICKNVWCTSGNVTEYLRRIWGWNDILLDLQLQRIKEIINNPLKEGITEIIEYETEDGQIHKKEVIKGWTKRDDHRHHAIDALVIACTKQGFIQRLNTLSAQGTRDELYKFVSERKEEFRESLSLVDKYFIAQRPFTTQEVKEKVAQIIVSFKPGKKVATWGKRFIKKHGKRVVVQKRVLVPRGPLSEESIYGKIKTLEKNKPLKYLFENPHLIFKPYIKQLVEKRLAEYNGDVKKALDSVKINPIYLDENKTIKLEYATCFKEEYVIKYPLESIKAKDIPYIVDKKIREKIEERLKQSKNEKEAFKEPLYFDENNTIPIKSVRLFTGLSAVEPIRYDKEGNPIGFVKPGNNHHLAIYEDENGKKIPHLCTFWHAVERKKYGLPVIIENPNEVWKIILSNKNIYPQRFLEKLPKENWKFIVSFQQNECFVISSSIESIVHVIENKKQIANNIYRVQKISYNGKQLEIFFRHIYETRINDSDLSRKLLKFYCVKSVSSLFNLNPIKVNITRLGDIVQ